MLYQKGVIPIIVLVALAAAVAGGFLGFKLGSGTFFSFGVGFGIVLIFWVLFYPSFAKLKAILYKGENER